jgi:cell division protein FtsW (lipid II flippase)
VIDDVVSVCRALDVDLRTPCTSRVGNVEPSRRVFGTLVAAGITIQIGSQAFFNIMVACNAFPNTGIALPFFSYGGSSLIMLLAQMGLILSISRTANIEKQ